MASAPKRVTFTEARDEAHLVQNAAAAVNLQEADVLALFSKATGRLRELLHLRANPFDISLAGTVRVDGIAGLLRLSRELELQVVPKFLDADDESWQEDFFVLALFSRTGRILPREQIRAGHADRGDLASLVGRTLTQMYWENHRRSLRTYNRRTSHDFGYDGEVEPVSLVLPEPDGFEQSVVQLRRDNEFNAVIAGAVSALLPEVRDAETRRQLLRVDAALAPQRKVKRAKVLTLPSRHRRWQPTYDLAAQILDGFGLAYMEEHLLAPGFVLRTWPTWQSLVEVALRSALPNLSVLGEQPYVLGTRSIGPLAVKPDVVVLKGGAPALIVDAKYRTRTGRAPGIDAGDVYETLAFMRATGTHRTVLLYPRPASDGSAQPVGTATLFERVDVGAECIVGMVVECRGISGFDGFGQFSSRVALAVKAHIP